ncbi:unnamed protein product [Strongylus vulgaris]|uniref:Uncharacterized protein n=1 Tax=Strongylus vulgaris TaxID=40348 RepID=A0A3P7JQZ0_STRVU|nr:unnamed protein product [Strongylus vulgaris]
MSYRTIALMQNSRRLLTCAQGRYLHTCRPQYGIIKDAGEKAQDMAEAAKEKLREAGKTVKETVKEGYEKVTDIGNKETDTVHGNYPRGNVGQPINKSGQTSDVRRGRGKGSADELGDAESGGAKSGKMKSGSEAYRE